MCFFLQNKLPSFAIPKQLWPNKRDLFPFLVFIGKRFKAFTDGILEEETWWSVRQLTAAFSGRFYRVTQFRTSSNYLQEIVWLFKQFIWECARVATQIFLTFICPNIFPPRVFQLLGQSNWNGFWCIYECTFPLAFISTTKQLVW